MVEIEALLGLCHTPSLGPQKIRNLISLFGSAKEALNQSSLRPDQKLWHEDLERAAKAGVKLIAFTDPTYPKCLLQISDFPLILYVKGELKPEDEKGIAIVGTRQCTIYGREMASAFAERLSLAGLTIVSGLARGIDTAAHTGAIKNGRTLAFIGSGLDNLYPKENKELAALIVKKGAVISEFPMNAAPEKHHFPRRNRLISAFSQAALLIEAPIKSGAMITMDYALAQEKKCFTIPGRADSESFRGNHFLIKSCKAPLVENAEEMLSLLKLEGVKFGFKEQYLFDIDEEEQKLLSFFPSEEIGLEELALNSKFPIAKLTSLLMGLILKQAVREFPGKQYKKVIE